MSLHDYRIILLSSSVIVLFVLAPYLSTPQVFATSATTGVLEPLYCDPFDGDGSPCKFANGTIICPSGSTTFCWQPLVNIKGNHTNVPFFVILNAANGPPTKEPKLTDYGTGITKLANAGIVVLGYVDTINCPTGVPLITAAEPKIDKWANYKSKGLSGIFFDDMTNLSGCEGYYTTLTNYTHATKGLTWTIGNPGTNTIQSYVGTVDKLDIFEKRGGTGIPSVADLQTGTFSAHGANNDLGIDKSNFSFLVYNQCSLPDIKYLGNQSNFVKLMYFTDAGFDTIGTQCTNNQGMNDPWNRTSSYISSLVSSLDKPSALVTINAVNSTGSPLLNLQVNMTQNSTIIPGGFTPFTYNGTTGVGYTFIPTNSASCTFTKWKDTGSGPAARNIPVGSVNKAYTAVYSCTGIELNNVQSTSGKVSSSPFTLNLSNFDASNGTNRLLVVGVSANTATVSSVTFGGTSLSKKVASSLNNDAEFWYLANPTSGTGNIVVTMSGSTSAVVGAYALSGVNQANPLPTTKASNNTVASSPTITLTTQFANSKVIDLPSIFGGVMLSSPTCVQHWNVNLPNAITGASSAKNIPSPSATTCSWIATSGDFWDDVAVEVRPQ